MRNGMQESEDKNDARDWNRSLKIKIMEYYNATKSENLEENRTATLAILDLFYYENGGYDLEERVLGDETYNFASQVRDVVTGVWEPPIYKGTQEGWNQYVSLALEQGKLIPLLKLIRLGKKLAFLRTPGEEHADYFVEVKRKVNYIVKSIEENQI